MSACCGPTCSKVFVVLYNILFWISGIAFTALGGLLIYDKTYEYMYTLLNIHPEKYPPELLFYTAYAVISLGGLILFVGFFGCCGALQNSKCMIGMYIFFLIIICFAEAAIALGCVYCHFSIGNSGDVKNGMRNNFQEKYRFNSSEPFPEAVDYVQFTMKCCGIFSEKDYEDIINKPPPPRGGGGQNNRPRKTVDYPATCCVPQDNFFPVDEAWKTPPPKNNEKCQTQVQGEADFPPPMSMSPFQDGRYIPGCWNRVNDYFRLLTCILAGASGGFAILQILGILFSLCFIRSIGEEA